MTTSTPGNFRAQLTCAWCVVPFVLSFFVGLIVADFLIPPAPSDSANDIAALYQDHKTAIRIGILLCFTGCLPFMLWGGAIIGQFRRIEGVAPALTYAQIASLAIAVMIVLVPAIFFFVAAYRPERDPEITQTLNDLGWTMFVMSFPPFMAWPIALAIGILGDKHANPIFPRWAAYFNIYVSFVYIPPALLIFTKTGPVAWNGVLAWYIPVADFFIWATVMTVLAVKAINRQEADGRPEERRPVESGTLIPQTAPPV